MIPRIFLICLIGTLCGVTLTISDSRNRPTTEIPFEIAFRGVAFVPAKVNGGPPMQFLIDTGAGTHIDRELAKRLGLEMARGVATASGNAQLEVGVIQSATTQVGDVHTPDRSNTLTLLLDGKTLQVVLKTREMLP